jgi:hypothetical protein
VASAAATMSFLDRLSTEMAAHGWTDSTHDPLVITPIDGRFYKEHTGGGDFANTVQFTCRSEVRGPGRSDMRSLRVPAVVHTDIGITPPAVERLLWRLGARHRNAANETDIGELLMPARDASVRIATCEQLEQAVGLLVSEVVGNVRVHGGEESLEGWLADLRADPDGYEFQREFVPAAFVAFDRRDEAREAVAMYLGAADLEYQAFGARLAQFLDSGDVVPLPGDMWHDRARRS